MRGATKCMAGVVRWEGHVQGVMRMGVATYLERFTRKKHLITAVKMDRLPQLEENDETVAEM